jgi:hypothetical protein
MHMEDLNERWRWFWQHHPSLWKCYGGI